MLPIKKKPKVKTQVSTITNALRRIWLWSPERRQAIKRAGGAGLQGFCEECGKTREQGAKIEVHHLDPVDLTKEAKRVHTKLLPPAEALLCLCRDCHQEVHQ